MRMKLISTPKIGAACSSKIYKTEQYCNPANAGLNKESVLNKMSLNGVHVLILQKKISDL
jgi:hypothetical protein